MNFPQTPMQTCTATAAANYARMLLGCFRRGEAEDGPTYVRAVVANLTCYPEDVVRAVCDPRSGLPVKTNFLPTPKEIREACDAKMRPLLDAEARRRREAENAADRPSPLDDVALDRRKAVVANYRANQAIRDAKALGAEMALADMDARQLKGQHAELVKQAISTKLEALKADCQSSLMKLSPAALRAIAPELCLERAVTA